MAELLYRSVANVKRLISALRASFIAAITISKGICLSAFNTITLFGSIWRAFSSRVRFSRDTGLVLTKKRPSAWMVMVTFWARLSLAVEALGRLTGRPA